MGWYFQFFASDQIYISLDFCIAHIVRPLGHRWTVKWNMYNMYICIAASSTGKMCAMQKCIIIWLGKWNWYYKFNAIIWMTVVNILKNWKSFKEHLGAIHSAAFVGYRMLMYLIPFNEIYIYLFFKCVCTLSSFMRFAICVFCFADIIILCVCLSGHD